MRKVSIILALWLLWASSLVAAEEVSLNALMTQPPLYDNQEIEVTAEVLEIFSDERGSWINLYEKGASMGAWVSDVLPIPEITHLGGYNEQGDIIKVRGIFYQACPVHLGRMEIHAQSLSVVRKGGKNIERISLAKKKVTFLLCGCFAVVLLVYAIKRYRRQAKRTPAS